jgi:tRNA A58 N-methylase Trm61
MLDMAGVRADTSVLDHACGAGSQTLDAARRVGPHGTVVAADISETMLDHVRHNARALGLDNVTTIAGAAEDLDLDLVEVLEQLMDASGLVGIEQRTLDVPLRMSSADEALTMMMEALAPTEQSSVTVQARCRPRRGR